MTASSLKSKDYNICVGVVTAANGVRGHVKIRSFTAKPGDIANFQQIFDEESQAYGIRIIALKKDYVIAGIEGVASRDEAEKLRNRRLYIKRSELPAVSNDEFYHADLVGLDVRTEGGTKLGIVKDVANFGAGDILEVCDATSERVMYYPFNKQFVPLVDVVGRYVVVCPLEEVVAASE